jgi:hypothetical protein
MDVLRESATDIDRELKDAKKSRDEPLQERLVRDLQMINKEVRKLEREQQQIRRGRMPPEEGDPAEKARKAVGNALTRLKENCCNEYGLPRFADHMDAFRCEGTSYVYRPPGPAPNWQLFL